MGGGGQNFFQNFKKGGLGGVFVSRGEFWEKGKSIFKGGSRIFIFSMKKKQKTPILVESWINFPCFGVKHVNSLTKRVFFIEIFTE